MQLFHQKKSTGPIAYDTEREKRMHRCCFTGHRPEKLTRSDSEIKAELRKEINLAVQDGFHVFITGMARGVDLWAAGIVLDLRRKDKTIKLICAIPYEGFETRWSDPWQRLYRKIRSHADLVRILSDSYSGDVFQIRNEWMVDHSSRVIAVFNGQSGGTKNTLDYAAGQNVSVRIIEG